MWSEIAKRCRRLITPERVSGVTPSAKEGAAADADRASQAADAHDRRRYRPPDDLTVIKGIGPVMRDRLRILGIATFADLADADAGELTRWLRRHQPISEDVVRSWVQTARDRTRP